MEDTMRTLKESHWMDVPVSYAIKLSNGGNYYYRRGPVPHWVRTVDESTVFQSADEAVLEKASTLELYETTLVGLVSTNEASADVR
jgi:hypothetical protein